MQHKTSAEWRERLARNIQQLRQQAEAQSLLTPEQATTVDDAVRDGRLGDANDILQPIVGTGCSFLFVAIYDWATKSWGRPARASDFPAGKLAEHSRYDLFFVAAPNATKAAEILSQTTHSEADNFAALHEKNFDGVPCVDELRRAVKRQGWW